MWKCLLGVKGVRELLEKFGIDIAGLLRCLEMCCREGTKPGDGVAAPHLRTLEMALQDPAIVRALEQLLRDQEGGA